MRILRSMGAVLSWAVAIHGVVFVMAALIVVGVYTKLAAADDIVQVNSQAALDPTDSVDWGVLGAEGSYPSDPFSVTSIPDGISITGSTVASLGQSFFRFDQTSNPGPDGWYGDFNPGDHLLYTSGTSITLQFTTPVSGVGAEIQSNIIGSFTGTLVATAYSPAGGSLGSYDVSGISSYGPFGTAPFLGIQDLSGKNISSVVFSSTNAGSGFAIDTLQLSDAGLDAAAVPVAAATSTQTASVAGDYSTPGTGQTFTYAAYEILPGAVASLALGDTLDLTSGPLFVAAGGTFNASGTVNGNIINAGLVHITAPSFSTFTNQGTVVFQPPTGGATYSLQSFTNDAGGTFFGGGEAASPVVINLPAGQALQNQGEAVVGDLTVNGSYTQTSTGETLFDLGGPDPIYGYSQLTVNGTVDLSGTIQTDYINGFYPTVGETFDLLIASGGITFDSGWAGMPEEPGFTYALVDDGTVFEATFTGVVPEPASLSLVGLCGLGLLRRRKECVRGR
jgi:hypothetical protein